MFRLPAIASTDPRRGVILMVVLVLLTLFAIVGLSFALYADAEAKSAQINREAEVAKQPDVDPEMLLSFFLGQLVYDQDNVNGVYSAMRGHSLARSMFGYNDTSGATNLVAFNGTGRLRGSTASVGVPALAGVDDSNIVNYTYYAGDGGVVDPEYTGFRASASPISPHTGTYFGVNAPYTYPDINNMYLAAVRPDGTVLLPSFHRYWNPSPPSTAPSFGSLGPINQNWYTPSSTAMNPAFAGYSPNPALKYQVLRPRPIDQVLATDTFGPPIPPLTTPWPPTNRTNYFPAPEDAGGDVKNFVGGPGFYDAATGTMANNDSFWMDLGAPEMIAPDGRKFKALFAPLIVDLDHCVNLNVHGNILAINRPVSQTPPVAPSATQLSSPHLSNQGWGPWTVNLSQVLTSPAPAAPAQPPEWANLFLGLPSAYSGVPSPTIIGRYGLDGFPGPQPPPYSQAPPAGVSSPIPGTAAHFYNHFDYDGCDDNGNPTSPFTPAGTVLSCFPTYPLPAAGVGGGYSDAMLPPPASPNSQELLNHPLIYNYFTTPPGSYDRVFSLSNMEALLRYGDTGSANITSDLLRLCPQNFSDPRKRMLVTLRSFDIDTPGIVPWLWGQGPGSYVLAPNPTYIPYPTGTVVGFPTTVATAIASPTEFASIPSVPTPTPDFRSLIAALGRLDLNRTLPDYPIASGAITDMAGFMAAQTARQDLALDIYNRLRAITGAVDPTTVAPSSTDFQAVRMLAQLAVNIVDFIDNDDIITPFQWCTDNTMTPQFVYGTELPRVVINEAYAEWTKPAAMGNPVNVSVWVELLNTFNTDASLANSGDAMLTNAYQLVLCQPDPPPTGLPVTNPSPYYRRPDNVTGTPNPILGGDTSMVYTTSTMMPALVNTWTTPTIAASNGLAGPNGYYLVGPAPLTGGGPALDNTSSNMKYVYTPPAATPITQPPPAPTVMLQRLACPYIAAQPNPAMPFYNPFITVDYMQNVDADPNSTSGGYLLAANEHTAVMNTPTAAHSDGKNQPYYGYSAFIPSIMPPSSMSYGGKQLQQSTTAGQIQNTFKAVNSPLPGAMPTTPLDWLVHLDRQLVSPAELLHVSAYKPHELTQEFKDFTPGFVGPQPFNQRVPWFDEDQATAATPGSHRLARFFEFVETRSRASASLAPSTFTSTTVTVPTPGSPTAAAIAPAAMSGLTAGGVPWSIQPGAVLTVDPGANQENVRVTSLVYPALPAPQIPIGFNAIFYRSHPAAMGTTPYQIILTSTGDRVPGKINLNTVFDAPVVNPGDPSTFNALCDAQSSNSFLASDASTIYQQLLNLRTPGAPMATPAIPVGVPTGSDVPFWGYGTGAYPAMDPQYASPPLTGPGFGINNTLLRASATGALGNTTRLFETTPAATTPGTLPTWASNPAITPPWVKYQLLSKLFSNITSRSNVFAVYVTVGFFEVIDDTVRPMKLGAEIGRSENRNIRHRMFAIVDRSRLTVPTQLAFGTNLTAITGPGTTVPLGVQTVTVGSLSGMIPPTASPQIPQIPWTIQVGSQLVIDYGTQSQETVSVTAVGANTFTATFRQAHALGASVCVAVLPGNPGPQPRFNPRDPLYAPVVPYFSVIN